jgi:hypothetical protein
MDKVFVCTNCGFIGQPKKFTKGSLLWEVILWILFIVPGIFYSIWRLSSRYEGCPKCQSPNMIPEDTPKAQEIIRNQKLSPE